MEVEKITVSTLANKFILLVDSFVYEVERFVSVCCLCSFHFTDEEGGVPGIKGFPKRREFGANG